MAETAKNAEAYVTDDRRDLSAMFAMRLGLLSDHPLSGRQIGESYYDAIGRVDNRAFLIRYRVEEAFIRVVRVFYGESLRQR